MLMFPFMFIFFYRFALAFVFLFVFIYRVFGGWVVMVLLCLSNKYSLNSKYKLSTFKNAHRKMNINRNINLICIFYYDYNI